MNHNPIVEVLNAGPHAEPPLVPKPGDFAEEEEGVVHVLRADRERVASLSIEDWELLHTPRLVVPEDLDEANAHWGANCGPAAIAAVLGCPLADVWLYLPSFADRPYMSPTRMEETLRAMGAKVTKPPSRFPAPRPHALRCSVRFGVGFVQWVGPWLFPGVPAVAAYQRTHWIALDHVHVYDVNVPRVIRLSAWERVVVPMLTEDIRKATGAWYLRTGFEVER